MYFARIKCEEVASTSQFLLCNCKSATCLCPEDRLKLVVGNKLKENIFEVVLLRMYN